MERGVNVVGRIEASSVITPGDRLVRTVDGKVSG